MLLNNAGLHLQRRPHLKKKKQEAPVMVVAHLQSQHWRLRQENFEFKASLGYVARPCLKKTENKQKLAILGKRYKMTKYTVVQ
jgi:hypothetical protein